MKQCRVGYRVYEATYRKWFLDVGFGSVHVNRIVLGLGDTGVDWRHVSRRATRQSKRDERQELFHIREPSMMSRPRPVPRQCGTMSAPSPAFGPRSGTHRWRVMTS